MSKHCNSCGSVVSSDTAACEQCEEDVDQLRTDLTAALAKVEVLKVLVGEMADRLRYVTCETLMRGEIAEPEKSNDLVDRARKALETP